MTIGQAQSTPFNCPRCESPMYKPAGSSFYWHAENNHPPCNITNIADTAGSEKVVPASKQSKSRKGMSERLS
ncbi:MAG TPA: hypothetical protein VHV10_21005 [Ktedonobacteraceae bacterium]|nr:hypothetical protein [Ktedonobacteraceae bacterium]